MQAFLLSVLLISSVSGVFYNLTFERELNSFELKCHAETNVNVMPTFWINETDRVYITADKSIGSRHSIISYILEPQNEGTFYCGEADGEHSNGVGPFAGMMMSQNHFSHR